MPRPIIQTSLYVGSRIVPGPTNYNHQLPAGDTEGFIAVLIFYAHTGAAAAVATCLINGAAAVQVFDRVNATGSTAGHRMFRSATPLPAGTYPIQVGAAAPSNNYGTLMFFSVARWNGTVNIVAGSGLGPAFVQNLGVQHNGANDLPFAIWSVRVGSGAPGLLDNDNLVTYEHTQGGASISGISGLTQTRTLTSIQLPAPTSPGSVILDATQSGWGTTSLAWIGTGLAFKGVVVNAQAVGGALNFSGAMSKQATRRSQDVAGSLGFAGDMTRRAGFSRLVSGDVTFAGGLVAHMVNVKRAFTGSLRFVGDVVPEKVTTAGSVIISGTVAFSGALNRGIQRRLSGILSFAGNTTTIRFPVRMLVGTLSFSGTLARAFIKSTKRFIVAAQRRVGYKRLGDNP